MKGKKIVAVTLSLALAVGCTGCGKAKKEPKPTPKTTAKVSEGNANASGKGGDGQSDVPIVISSGKFSKQLNPFMAASQADKQVVDLTQVSLLTNDRAGRTVYKGIDGELREYNDTNYTYYGASDLKVTYNKEENTTKYHITLREDMQFSDGEKVTIDDVIFTLYAFCDKSYVGSRQLKNMPIKGLINYQANSTKAEKISGKKVNAYVKKMPAKLKKWIDKYIIKKELTNDMVQCQEEYANMGYNSAMAYFQDKYRISVNEEMTEDQAVKKAVTVYKKKGYKKLAKILYGNKKYFNTQIKNQARIYLAKKKGKKVTSISGIKKLGDYELEITTNGYCKEMTSNLSIPICALHYYGDTSKYEVSKGKYGFKRGDISALLANKSTPVGAGPYRFVKFEDSIAYFTSNEMYYLGCPQIAFLQVRDMTDDLKDAKLELKEKIAQNGTEKTEDTESAINPVAEITELTAGNVDVLKGVFTKEEIQWITKTNSNEKVTGDKINSAFVSNGSYYYVGIHGKNVAVGKDGNSEASVNLRKALATVISGCRGALQEEKGNTVRIVNYPVAAESWVSLATDDDRYEVAYGKDIQGKEIFTEKDPEEKKPELAAKMALEYFKAAGYTVENEKVTKAPAGASLQYTILVANGENNPLYASVSKAKEALASIGITLKIKSVSGNATLDRKLQKGSQQLWVGYRNINDMDMEKRYTNVYGKNIFGVANSTLSKNIVSLQNNMTRMERKATYEKCFDNILNLAVEVPVCEYRDTYMFSAERIVSDSVTENFTPYYSWLNEIQKISTK